MSDLFPEDKQPAPMTAENRLVALAEAYVRLEALKLEWKRYADELWLKMYGPDNRP